MTAALITATTLSVLGLTATFVLGFTVVSRADLLQHTTLGIFTALIVLLSHSFTMFYLIGKGKAIREAVSEGELSNDFVVQVMRARRPVFSVGTLAMLLTITTAILGGAVDTRTFPSLVHSVLGGLTLLTNFETLRGEIRALLLNTRISSEVDRLLEMR